MLRWFHALMPKEERFFDLFARHSQAVLAGAEALRAMLEGGEAVERNCATVMEREHDADDVTREVLIAVRRTFITPFDRGSIRELITAMDNTIDQMQKATKTVILFDARSFTPQMKEMADLIVKCAALVKEAVPLLHAISAEAVHISALTEQISALEGRADDLHDTGLKALFQANAAKSDAMAFFIGHEIYDHLEKVVDRFDDVANVMHGIVIEHV
jgi:predicted phosphate transport protein (TIGR00153 family)